MNILNFTTVFLDKNSCKIHFKNKEKKKVLFVKNVDARTIIDYIINGNGSVKPIILELH
jgi:hypothetical protein